MRRVVLEQIRVHPLKGARGVRVDAWEVDELGLALDRRWMLVDGGGRFLTQRTHRALALVDVAVEGDCLAFSVEGRGTHATPLRPPEGERATATVWGDRVEVLTPDPGADRWFSGVLGEACRLVHMPPDSVRPVNPEYAPGHRVGFADGYPFLLVSRGSLDELARRAGAPIPAVRFRPNLVVAGTVPHEEDGWRRFSVGGIRFDAVKPCPRCVVTTIDPATGSAGKEPMRTLAGYRRWNGEVFFGQNLVHDGTGTLRAGDVLQVEERGEPRPPLLPPETNAAADMY